MKGRMNKYLLFLILISTFCKAQEVKDTIYVSEQNTVYLVYPSEVDLVNIGVVGDYYAKMDMNSVFLKASKPNAQTSSLLVRCQDNYYFAVIKYTESPTKINYDFRNDKDKKTTKTDTSKQNKIGISNVNDSPDEIDDIKRDRLNVFSKEVVSERLKNTPVNSEIKTLGTYSDKIYISVSSIANDQTHFYFKIIVKNTSSIDYKIDIVNFQYIEVFKKGLFKKKQEKKNDLFPTIKPKDLIIKGKKNKVLAYAIPLFALNEKGKLSIQFREYSGNRIMTIIVNSEYLSNALKIE
ncbi:MAG: hypothetical protein A2275_05800 [Bacteroidetes bacterium RIFOXYA12_FULL_35_11]|nr:MAG: hypothetical protein A2X01_10965 [Bacteroidetes bacterium GWF2_35_48]OFY74995.1 MAG: hypothetical protein A2275_05800 [Bacteroidetes bacterium RIFOXYA12_FULL_35_11]OFY94586.1 MAG: hypothetical protein A2309_08690 [Bacteroidetes bacterium RIFOXYB2_FULL_35_7]OFZ00159.1 MAG: hypothetical protein A2491_19430 [Bacteroidetes bacterium RIFOXYC12_FULL_35_7]HBX52810.1 hypothetical protein [Bacteroidales bacterium]